MGWREIVSGLGALAVAIASGVGVWFITYEPAPKSVLEYYLQSLGIYALDIEAGMAYLCRTRQGEATCSATTPLSGEQDSSPISRL
jgi:hypothetical protein